MVKRRKTETEFVIAHPVPMKSRPLPVSFWREPIQSDSSLVARKSMSFYAFSGNGRVTLDDLDFYWMQKILEAAQYPHHQQLYGRYQQTSTNNRTSIRNPPTQQSSPKSPSRNIHTSQLISHTSSSINATTAHPVMFEDFTSNSIINMDSVYTNLSLPMTKTANDASLGAIQEQTPSWTKELDMTGSLSIIQHIPLSKEFLDDDFTNSFELASEMGFEAEINDNPYQELSTGLTDYFGKSAPHFYHISSC
jgi:hypothetical protein